MRYGQTRDASTRYSSTPTASSTTGSTTTRAIHTIRKTSNIHVNWSHSKSEFSGKPEDAEAHLLWTNDWMNAHHFLENIKLQRFCSTLVGETRLQYEFLTPIHVDWQGLQNLFRQQYSKLGNTRTTISYLEILLL